MKINELLRPLVRPIDTCFLDPKNARKHPPESIDRIKASLTTFGQQKPIVVDSDGVALAGNGLLQAALALGWTEIAVTVYDGTEEGKRAFALADNKTAEYSIWDYERVKLELDDLTELDFDLDKTGFQQFEIDLYMDKQSDAELVTEETAEKEQKDVEFSVKFSDEQWAELFPKIKEWLKKNKKRDTHKNRAEAIYAILVQRGSDT